MNHPTRQKTLIMLVLQKLENFKSSNLNSLFGLCEPDLILPFQLLEKIRNLSKPIIVNRNNTIYAASVAFIAG
jgi:hypothetical protein